MQKHLSAAALIVAITSPVVLRADITTVFLAKEKDTTITVANEANSPLRTGTLTFAVTPEFRAKVLTCILRVVPTAKGSTNQDVTLSWNGKPVGLWSAYSVTTKLTPFSTKLAPESCNPGTTVLTLKTESARYSKWDYYGGGAGIAANRPRLIVTYDAPPPGHSVNVTGWAYSDPAGFFSSRLTSAALLTNPVSWRGALYFVSASGGTNLVRLASAGDVQNWPLSFSVDKGSYAFVTSWGRLEIISVDAIHRCDLAAPPSCRTEPGKITVQARETPAMGPDGSIYFRNSQAAGRIIAYSPLLQEIWRSEDLTTQVSAIALNASGRSAYMLAEISGAEKQIALLQIDTATGETNSLHKIVKPLLQQLLKPAVITKTINGRAVDYVFVAGNSNDTGVLQLVAFEPGASPRLVWNREAKSAVAPVPSLDGNSLFVASQDGTIARYPWYNTTEGKTGAYPNPEPVEPQKTGSVSQLLADRNGSVYLAANNRLQVYQAHDKKLYTSPIEVGARTLQFTDDGTLIGYDATDIYNLSPKSGRSLSSPVLLAGTIYSADTITLPDNPDVKPGNQVILKGNSMTFPVNFKWPAGAMLQAQSVPLPQ